MARFLRSYELVLGENDKVGDKITDLQVQFDIEKSKDSEMNTANFKIYNLSNNTRERIHNLEDKDGLVRLKVAYGSESLVQVFVGQIIQVSSSLKAPDIITEVMCGDGYLTFRDNNTNIQLPKRTTLETILKALVKDTGQAEGVIKGKALRRIYLNGLTLEGRTVNLLDEYCHKAVPPLEWSIQDASVNILPKGSSTQETRLIINESTGMIGSPERTGKRPGAEKGSKEPTSGIKFQTLLNPAVTVHRKIRVESKYLKGDYVVTRVIHTGDYEGGNWYTIAEATTESKSNE